MEISTIGVNNTQENSIEGTKATEPCVNCSTCIAGTFWWHLNSSISKTMMVESCKCILCCLEESIHFIRNKCKFQATKYFVRYTNEFKCISSGNKL